MTSASRKTVGMRVVVTVPARLTDRQARREVRTLINERTTFMLEHGEVTATKVEPARDQHLWLVEAHAPGAMIRKAFASADKAEKQSKTWAANGYTTSIHSLTIQR